MSEVSDRAARIMKIIRLARNPMMDRVAVALNSNPTYDEKQLAREWAAAFEIANTDLVLTIPNICEEWQSTTHQPAQPAAISSVIKLATVGRIGARNPKGE